MDNFQRILNDFSCKSNFNVEDIKKNISSRKFTKDEASFFIYFQEDTDINPFLILMTKYYDQCANFRSNIAEFNKFGLQNQLICLYYGIVNLLEKKELAIDNQYLVNRLDENLAKIISKKTKQLERVKSKFVNTYKYGAVIDDAHYNEFSEIEPRVIGLCYKEILLDIISASEEERNEFIDQEVRVFFPGVKSDQYNFSLLENLPEQQKYLLDEIVNSILTNFDKKATVIFELIENLNTQLVDMERDFENMQAIKPQTTALQITDNVPEKGFNFANIEKYLKERIIGQDAQIEQFIRRLQILDYAGIKENGAKGVFLLAGPTGVGKTELAKLTSKHSNYPLIRMDMSEYKESHSISKIHGSPPGYVGYDERGNKVFDQILQSPQSIVLLDEIEKAHPRVLDVFLHIFDEGYARDNKQNEIDFSETIFVLTTNIGAFEASKRTIGFHSNPDRTETYRDAIESRLLPEFINRIDEIVYFKHLQKEDIYSIIDISLERISQKFAERGYQYEFQIQPEAVEHLINTINYEKYGARDVFRVLSDKIIPPLLALNIQNKNAQIDINFEDEIIVNQIATAPKTKNKRRNRKN